MFDCEVDVLTQFAAIFKNCLIKEDILAPCIDFINSLAELQLIDKKQLLAIRPIIFAALDSQN